MSLSALLAYGPTGRQSAHRPVENSGPKSRERKIRCAAISGVDLIDRLPNLRQPTLVINGSLDAATPPAEHGDRIAAALPNARTVVLKAGPIPARSEERRAGKEGGRTCRAR